VRVTILANLEAGKSEPDAVVGQIAEALRVRGDKVQVVATFDDVPQLIADLNAVKTDLVFNLFESFGHEVIGGQMGVTGILDLLQLPYTGGGPGELFLQENKALSKKLLAYEQILYPDFAIFSPSADFETGGNLRMPLFVKPLRMDASLGIDEKSLVTSTQELMEKVLKIHKQFGDAALAEEYIDGRELYVGVLGNQNPLAFPPIEIDFSGMPAGSLKVMDSEAKFDESSERYQGTKPVVAKLDPELKARLQRIAVEAYRALHVHDYGRLDMRLTESGEIYVIEVNASCYLEREGEFVMAAEAHGMGYNELIGQIADLAIERWKHRTSWNKRKRRSAARLKVKPAL
jgi:D-alanine-D-alanine ligase